MFNIGNKDGTIAGGYIVMNGEYIQLEEFAQTMGFETWEAFVKDNPVVDGVVNLSELNTVGTKEGSAGSEDRGDIIPLDSSAANRSFVPGFGSVRSTQEVSPASLRETFIRQSRERATVGINITDIYKDFL